LVEAFGLIQRGGVAGIGDHHQPRIGQQFYVGLFQRDRCVVTVGADDEGWTGNPRKSFLHPPPNDCIEAGEICLFVFVSSKHRKTAFEACQDIVEQLKAMTPIWGKEIFEDDSFVWKENQI